MERIGAAGYGEDGKLHPTTAGLLMFGEEYHIVREFPEYIFLNLDDDKFYFIYYKSEESNEGLKPLIGFLIERINTWEG